MKRIDLKNCSNELSRLCDEAQDQNILLVRDGQPFATLMGLLNKDDEDIELQASASFWRMIRERRRSSKSISLEEFKKELDARERNGRRAKSAAKSPKKPTTRKHGPRIAKAIQP